MKQKNSNKENQILNKKIESISLFLQIFFVVVVGIVAIITTLINEFLVVLEILLGLTLIVMAYNNTKIYKRRFLSWLYGIFGLIVLITSIYSWFGGYIGI